MITDDILQSSQYTFSKEELEFICKQTILDTSVKHREILIDRLIQNLRVGSTAAIQCIVDGGKIFYVCWRPLASRGPVVSLSQDYQWVDAKFAGKWQHQGDLMLALFHRGIRWNDHLSNPNG